MESICNVGHAAGEEPHSSLTDGGSPVTAVILCFNHEKFVVQSLKSVAEQTVRPRSVIVVDDASSDNSRQAISDYLSEVSGEVTVLFHQTNRGFTRTLNESLALVDTKFVAFIAADDWLEPDRFEVQVREFQRSGPECAVVHSDLFQADEEGRRLPRTYGNEHGCVEPGDMFLAGIEKCAVFAPSALLRTSCLRAVGGFDESLPMEDFDLYLRLSRYYSISYLSQPLMNYRIVARSLSRTAGGRVFKEAMLTSLQKHSDIDGPVGDAVTSRIEELATVLYFDGRSAVETRRSLFPVLRRRPNWKTLTYVALATARVPGPWARRLAIYMTNLERRGRMHPARE